MHSIKLLLSTSLCTNISLFLKKVPFYQLVHARITSLCILFLFPPLLTTYFRIFKLIKLKVLLSCKNKKSTNINLKWCLRDWRPRNRMWPGLSGRLGHCDREQRQSLRAGAVHQQLGEDYQSCCLSLDIPAPVIVKTLAV